MDMSHSASGSSFSMHMSISSATPSSTMNMHSMSSTMSGMAASSTGMDMAGMNMGGMKMEHMAMNSYLTPKYYKYPLLFEHLSADTKAKAFGIFVLIGVAAFVYKLILFVSWCLEVHWFKMWSKEDRRNAELTAAMFADPDSVPRLPPIYALLRDLAMPRTSELLHDFLRTILVFLSTMLVYMLMLAAMSFVLTYVFAVILGITLSEVFFNRLKIYLLRRWELQREIERFNSCPGGSRCGCGRHSESESVSSSSTYPEKNKTKPKTRNNECCCEDNEIGEINRDRSIEVEVSDNLKRQEQAANMENTLMP